ncbi:MAG: fumarylacetoacetate hydrolase, partial [Planctomycetota bacterium]|nr:fumarylacetoacetate hydrolase [Planctomycetota bacterium]
MTARPTPEDTLPSSSETMVLLGRRWCPQRQRGVPVRVIGEKIVDLRVPTIAHLLQSPDPAAAANDHALFENGFTLDEALRAIGDRSQVHLLPPVDLQPIKAAGVTFIESMLERVIEEATHGDPSLATKARYR